MPTAVWLGVASLAIILSALFAFSYQSYRRERLAALARLPAGSHLVETACGPVEYAARGAGPTVLISHGLMGGYDQALVLAQGLGLDFTCIAVSRFGYLRSPLPADASPAVQADAFAALLDALGIRRAAIVGASAGGPSALQFALRHSDRCAALVLASSTTEAYQKLDPISLALSNLILRAEFGFWLLMKVYPRLMLDYCGVTPAIRARITPAEMDWVWRFMAAGQPVAPRRAGIINDMRQIAALPSVALEAILVPTLVTHAKDDRLVPPAHGENAARRIPGARLLLMEAGGHFGVGNRELFVQVDQFLQMHLEAEAERV